MTGFTFRHSLWLWLLLALPLLGFWRAWLLTHRRRALTFPPAVHLEGLAGRSAWYPWVSPALALVALLGLIAALARPVVASSRTQVNSEGVAILLVLDISGSMLAEDFQPSNRIDMAKVVVSDFIEKRPDDRIGLLTFAALPFLRCPLTSDHKILLGTVGTLRAVGRSDIDGTAIGDALVTAGKRLLGAPEKSKVMVLLTDGENNRGQFDPVQASELLAGKGIRVYTVGIGREGVVPYPTVDAAGHKGYQYVRIGYNAKNLEAIASSTKGVYYNASDAKGLQRVFDEIDRLERTKVTTTGYVHYRELFLWPLGLGLLLLGLEALWRAGPGRTLP